MIRLLCIALGAISIIPAQAALSPSPAVVRFVQAVGGAAPSPLSLRIDAPAGTSITVITPSSSWISTTTSITAPATLTVSVNGGGLAPVLYSDFLSILSPGSPSIAVPIMMVVFSAAADLSTFADVPANHEWADYIYVLGRFNVTIGCDLNPIRYCPGSPVTHGQMAAFVIRSMLGENFAFQSQPYFTDVVPGSTFFKYVQKMRELNIHTGCNATQYCQDALVTRTEMAAFVIRALYGENFSFWQIARFTDVASVHPHFKYVQKLYEIGVTQGCSVTEYCASQSITREQMAAFLNRAFFRYRLLALSTAPTGPPQALPAPTNVTAVTGDAQIALAWNAVSGATSYQVYGGLAAGQATAPIAMVNTASYISRNLLNGTRYFYRVAAINANGTGPFSQEVSAVPVAGVVIPPVTPPVGPTVVDLLPAWRFLRQSSFGPTQAAIDRVRQIGIPAYLDEQLAATPSTYPDTLLEAPSVEYIQEYFFGNAISGGDQLRQRVALALSQILVVSAVEVDNTAAMVSYLRILQNGALGNFFDLLFSLTISPAMGEYLDMVNNPKANLTTGAMPNENFGRELMQLFTIGLVELNIDGTPRLDGQGQPIPTYNQDGVMELTRALTGWTYPDDRPGPPTEFNYRERYLAPMEVVASKHDTGAKVIFGQTLPANQTASQDLDQALRILFNHSNVGPFLSRQLIQRLVTSDPSPTYIRDVATVFNNNGSGVRGDLRAVVRAILLHPESAVGRKLEEPVLFVTNIVRPLNATLTNYPFLSDLTGEMGQRVFYSPSVFNYYSPAYRIPGVGALAPEFQIFTTATGLTRANFASRMVTAGFGDAARFDLTQFSQFSGTPDTMVDRVANLFLGGRLPAQLRTQILAAIQGSSSNSEKARTALYMVFTSPHFQIDY